MMKLLPWRCTTSEAHGTFFSKISNIAPYLFLTNMSRRFLFHSQSNQEEDIFDPPFSLASNTLRTQKPKKKQKEEKKHEKDQSFTVNSELPFDYRFSYSETNPAVKPIGFREPTRFSPFGPGRIDRKWTGISAPCVKPVDLEKVAEERRWVLGEPLTEEETAELVEKFRHNDCSRQMNLEQNGRWQVFGGFSRDVRKLIGSHQNCEVKSTWARVVLGWVTPGKSSCCIPLCRGSIGNNLSTSSEVAVWTVYILPSPDPTLWEYTGFVVVVVRKLTGTPTTTYFSVRSGEGRGGVTHNMLEDIHNYWKRAEAVRIKCLGVPTLDMDNVCSHLEDKSGGKVIYRHINILLLYRGRNYDPKSRPTVPVMLWKPLAPIYPRLVKNVADGLTFEETKAMRNKGLNAPPLTKLSRNGVYVNVVNKVRAAFETEEVVRLDCTHVGTSDCKRIGVKLRDLVPCVPILFKDEQIILWRGKKDEQNSGS
ncbi:CRS2-associated factor 2, mitochondrial [Capsicum chinense]|nr:CRS2-associated factor 2, mitochondrial [Capsicum chinense]